ncbi:uroporphyrinogen-III synthase [Salarchaeum sp. JOR-1]|uniref:uroporphyrinogen-III synthase n=1 Tax=Salarchaeum sp. JOR-1 TaxID=2599399 RepID=UPI001198C5B2|nr:uroporphyrinogen-III synthase [Salarchaeum sp. JOR-1]QDX40288.1 uroporphyrinogen-III synthase [Salarchaeum sp. JOR-1]
MPDVAVFRPDDGRLARAGDHLEARGATPVLDPMLEVAPTGNTPRDDADFVVFTSKTGAELVADAGWVPSEATVCAIGESTRVALETEGFGVDVVPGEYSSTGLVNALRDRVGGLRVEVARSDHGSDVLLDGVTEAGAYVHETVLYRLTRPAESGVSAERAAAGSLDAALFTSSLTVEHFLDAAAERDRRAQAIEGLNRAVVGTIGEPTRRTAEERGIEVDVVPDEASFEALADAVLDEL